MTTHSPMLPDLIPDQSLFVCRKSDGQTPLEPYSHWGPLSRRSEIEYGLDDHQDQPLKVSERIVRGDFDA